MAVRAIQLKPPKLGCIPIRPFLMFISFLGLLGASSWLITNPLSIRSIIICSWGIVFNGFLFYGALKYHDRTLKASQGGAIYLMINAFIFLCCVPVYYTSYISSDYYKYKKIEVLGSALEIIGHLNFSDKRNFSEIAEKEAGVKFFSGLIMGEVIVFSIIIFALYSYMIFVMLKRVRKFIATRKEIDGNETLA
ncbi:hypothetical protein B9Z55_021035 [Caenorhabditis nigoni]|uniref:7TM GPCR serpentine receptor class x (Srx) domain-containing protein n=1 Tax=Caenorhabditis nigoni TaxID=1611254 RepID=A0A2G5TQF0_9PELO|nr:hypothetical protein B9Z55_021035 [Caenorhabditis nigoni]